MIDLLISKLQEDYSIGDLDIDLWRQPSYKVFMKTRLYILCLIAFLAVHPALAADEESIKITIDSLINTSSTSSDYCQALLHYAEKFDPKKYFGSFNVVELEAVLTMIDTEIEVWQRTGSFSRNHREIVFSLDNIEYGFRASTTRIVQAHDANVRRAVDNITRLSALRAAVVEVIESRR